VPCPVGPHHRPLLQPRHPCTRVPAVPCPAGPHHGPLLQPRHPCTRVPAVPCLAGPHHGPLLQPRHRRRQVLGQHPPSGPPPRHGRATAAAARADPARGAVLRSDVLLPQPGAQVGGGAAGLCCGQVFYCLSRARRWVAVLLGCVHTPSGAGLCCAQVACCPCQVRRWVGWGAGLGFRVHVVGCLSPAGRAGSKPSSSSAWSRSHRAPSDPPCRARRIKDLVLVRLEQVSPFPHDLITRVLSQYPNAELVWWAAALWLCLSRAGCRGLFAQPHGCMQLP